MRYMGADHYEDGSLVAEPMIAGLYQDWRP
jgi:hypothetical protein